MERQDEPYDVCVAGGGASGLTAAVLLSRGGLKVAVIAPERRGEEDTRTIALMQPSIRLLRNLGLWPNLEVAAHPLKRLKIIDDTGSIFTAPTLDFTAGELGLDAFGWSMPLHALLRELGARCDHHGVARVMGTVAAVEVGSAGVSLSLAGGRSLRSKIVVAADGAESPVRSSLNIRTERWAYDQTAIAARFTHSVGHASTSCEYHRRSGPLTTVPLPGDCSGLVWLERPARAASLMALDDVRFARELQAAIHGDLGVIALAAPRVSIPMRGLIAPKFGSRRVLLVGEAAHVAPPLGAQGLNMSLRDAATAAELLLDGFGGGDLGSPALLEAYAKLRRPDVVTRQRLIHTFNRSLLGGFPPLGAARALALSAVDRIGPLRRFVMKEGLEPSLNLPRSMR